MFKLLAILNFAFAVLYLVSAETGCPEAKKIEPCTCAQAPHTYLECKDIEDAETLRTVFRNSQRYHYTEVHLEYCTLQFLPHEMFESAEVMKLYLKNVTLAQLFDSPPNGLKELLTLHMENAQVLRGIIWQLLKPMENLRILNIYYNSIKTLDADFSENVPKSLEHLRFYATETKKYKPGVLKDLPNLKLVACDNCKLTALTRDIFPVPSNVEFLYFSENKITTIPNDLFRQMPNLKSVSLRKNQITTLPEDALEGWASRLNNLWLDDNPLKCDCLLLWLIKNKPYDLRGKCNEPQRLQDKELKDLAPQDFNC